MNIQALNATSNLTRPRAPRRVSFGNNIAGETAKAAQETVENAPSKLKQLWGATKPFREAIAEGFSKFRKKGGEFFSSVGTFIKTNSKKVLTKAQKFVEDNKGSKGLKKIAVALTAVLTGALAIKEIRDIATDSNAKKA